MLHGHDGHNRTDESLVLGRTGARAVAGARLVAGAGVRPAAGTRPAAGMRPAVGVRPGAVASRTGPVGIGIGAGVAALNNVY